jgi:hypothetical protein
MTSAALLLRTHPITVTEALLLPAPVVSTELLYLGFVLRRPGLWAFGLLLRTDAGDAPAPPWAVWHSLRVDGDPDAVLRYGPDLQKWFRPLRGQAVPIGRAPGSGEYGCRDEFLTDVQNNVRELARIGLDVTQQAVADRMFPSVDDPRDKLKKLTKRWRFAGWEDLRASCF